MQPSVCRWPCGQTVEGLEQPLILKIFGFASGAYFNQKKVGEGPAVDREIFCFLTSIVLRLLQ